jgi:tetratricopeptide (TPR) repeat protein
LFRAVHLLLSLLLFGQFVPPVKIGVDDGATTRISPKPIPFPTDATWQRATTPHFDIISAASERRTREVGQRLETLAAALHELRPASNVETPRARVILFGRRRDAQPYFDILTSRTNTRVAGLFVAKRDRGAMIIDASRDTSADRTPYHELVHYLLGNTRRLPLWLEEGLAEFYSNAEIGNGDITVGYPIREHMRLLNQRVAMTPAELFAMKFESEAAGQPIFYAQSWAVVDYLIRTDRPAFAAFLTDAGNGIAAETALRDRFHIGAKEVRNIFAIYANDERPGFTFRLPVPRVDVDVQPAPLRRAELLTELGSFLTTIDALLPEAERHMRAALELEPENAQALVALGELRMRQKKFDDAERLFAHAAAAAPNDGEVTLAYAEALLRDELGPFAETNHVGPQDVERFHRARILAQRALELRADAGRAYGVIGTSYIGDTDRTPGIAALEKAHALLPGRADHALHLAALLRRSGRIAEADALFAQLDAMHDAQVSFAARAIVVTIDLERINDLIRMQKLDDAIAAMHALAAKTEDAQAKADLERQARNIEAVRGANAEITAYNHAVALSNTGHIADAIKALDELLAAAHDPEVIADATRVRKELAKRKAGRR